ncbi:hypothetical protein EPJ74_03960 [Brachyspira aalborgi]|uniref:Uncharacterized protein n=1 Tax=Brachyspira aalborgi TaxID=29522 RepID=A0A5C8GHJ4_9SPIR|nr:hypothetical protein [Brachyspira aalborgi]TXJ35437.1 hypothetical protein EPJ78_11030 [Brachyspira aalborgi]TXJ61392.1 hypothetical protein EPJ74_03960 [Brachyspira aalborgi]
MCIFVKDNFVFKIILYILIINFSIYLTAFSKTNLNNFFSGDFSTNEFLARKFAKERQLISVNLLPTHSVIFPNFINSFVKNIETFAGLAQINIGEDISKFLEYVDIKGSFWYVPSISYTFLFTRRVGLEAGISAQSITYTLNINKESVGNLMNKNGIGQFSGVVGGDTTFRASFVRIPFYIGLKVLLGMNYNIINTFKFGIESIISKVETINGVTGIRTKRETTDTALYISYELGWSINLFPKKNWRVKPSIDFSLFEIGYYVKNVNKGIYGDFKEGISFLGGGLINVNSTLPDWDSFSPYVDIITSLKISIFPRFGFTIRF